MKRKESLVVCIVSIMMLVIVSSVNANLISTDDPLPSPGLIYENMEVKVLTPVGLERLSIIFGESTYFLKIKVTNHNDFPVTIEEHITVTALRGGEVIFDFDIVGSGQLESGVPETTGYFVQEEWIDSGFTLGFFELAYNLRVPETEIDMTVIFRGFMYIKIGAFIFNANGQLA